MLVDHAGKEEDLEPGIEFTYRGKTKTLRIGNVDYPHEYFGVPSSEQDRDTVVFRVSNLSDMIGALKAGDLRQLREDIVEEIAIADGVSLPQELVSIANQIIRSRRILDLPEDWDGEGSPSFEEVTWWWAAWFITRMSRTFWNETKTILPTPSIYEGPEGSIDIVWRNDKRRLLINIEAPPSNRLTYSGLDTDDPDLVFNGNEFVTRMGDWIVRWLMLR